ncbi:helix-turn-helix domain-containing protein, partial [Escherichia coli]|nr:helix-turn-helix domain-containing protein [Escherichia coli]
QTLQKERMESARILLGQDTLSISEIAERCGYGHLSNFSLAYKAYFGMSPSIARGAATQIVHTA